jgi:DNA-binding transcriptional MerR regulator
MKLYHTISEVADQLGVTQSLLRFWESEFPDLRPTKNARGVRMYRQEDIDLIKRIKYLTKECGFTLDGAREQLRTPDTDGDMQLVDTLKDIRAFLVDLKSQM